MAMESRQITKLERNVVLLGDVDVPVDDKPNPPNLLVTHLLAPPTWPDGAALELKVADGHRLYTHIHTYICCMLQGSINKAPTTAADSDPLASALHRCSKQQQQHEMQLVTKATNATKA